VAPQNLVRRAQSARAIRMFSSTSVAVATLCRKSSHSRSVLKLCSIFQSRIGPRASRLSPSLGGSTRYHPTSASATALHSFSSLSQNLGDEKEGRKAAHSLGRVEWGQSVECAASLSASPGAGMAGPVQTIPSFALTKTRKFDRENVT
jgi:hypothetical protein